jgi:hypothetical protein
VVVEGEAGIGKTALLGQVLRSATRRGFETITGRAGVLERTLGYGIAVQLLLGNGTEGIYWPVWQPGPGRSDGPLVTGGSKNARSSPVGRPTARPSPGRG